MDKKATTPAGVRLLYALAAAAAWGGACGFARAPFWAVAVGGLAAAALAMWLEWRSLTRPVPGRKTDIRVLLTAAYVFLAVVGVGVTSLGYFAGEWLAARV